MSPTDQAVQEQQAAGKSQRVVNDFSIQVATVNGRTQLGIFSNPATEIGRSNGVIRLSRDEGQTWPVWRVLYPGGFAYSCLATLPDNSVGCLFERDGYKTITFARLSLDWLRASPAP